MGVRHVPPGVQLQHQRGQQLRVRVCHRARDGAQVNRAVISSVLFYTRSPSFPWDLRPSTMSSFCPFVYLFQPGHEPRRRPLGRKPLRPEQVPDVTCAGAGEGLVVVVLQPGDSRLHRGKVRMTRRKTLMISLEIFHKRGQRLSKCRTL